MGSRIGRTHFLASAAMLALALISIFACSPGNDSTTAGAGDPTRPTVEFEKYELDNGLDVILHVDASDPIAAVAMTFHVGSARRVSYRRPVASRS